jgi:hypothetical protein
MKMEQTEFQNIGISTTDAGVSPEDKILHYTN